MSARDEVRALVEHLDGEAAAEMPAYGRWLLTEGQSPTAENLLARQRRLVYYRAEMERRWAAMARDDDDGLPF